MIFFYGRLYVAFILMLFAGWLLGTDNSNHTVLACLVILGALLAAPENA